MLNNLEVKQKEFNRAMDRYENRKIYKIFGKFIAVLVVSLQIIIASVVLTNFISLWEHLFSLLVAYFFADFINGLVHMYMDNNDNYEGIAGPLIASFHLHHQKPLYKKNNILAVYFNESGSKIWLAIFQVIAFTIIILFNINALVLHIILYFSILSSIAEVSHYLCHVSNKNSKVPDVLRKVGLIMSKRHHGKHHLKDNVNYAFLNCMSDPLINIISKKFYPGYKNTTDKHFTNYKGKGTSNRAK